MNILVLTKQTFDTEEKVSIQNGRISEEGVEFVINPYDEYAIEEAVRVKEKNGGEVTVLTVGPSRSENALRTALAMGADKAVRIEPGVGEYDEFSVAKWLAAAIRNRPFDLILGGNMAVDSGSGQVAVRVAEELDIAHVTSITKLVLVDRKAAVERDVEGDLEMIEVSLPVLVTAQQGLNEPRYPSLPGIMKAKKMPLEIISIADLGLSEEESQSRTMVVDQYLPVKKQAGRILQGDLNQQVYELAQLLRTEAKVV
ncbi:electron transfer flavoprotein subunit beta/FixA family protein [Brevibacillus brevis]|uniref:Electron transfer flavoprotein subunit beta n=1 Tax=Brevibacillus brevis TaxID=1393 RepID=A0ABY9SYD3_BREBE|nr:electron transfer flavoprotein subunit beta/FixA family protein [Brevibacillus brevis]WNC12284.1 electron transfer flavoprotein subunit beta/FixA family protein [Brevibacillus brevis]